MMVDVSSVALSGFNASQARLQVAASNIANANTPNFRAGAVAQTTNEDGSVSTQFVAANPPPRPQPATQQDAAPRDTNDVDIATELVNTDIATYSAKANLKVLKVQDDVNKALLDIQA